MLHALSILTRVAVQRVKAVVPVQAPLRPARASVFVEQSMKDPLADSVNRENTRMQQAVPPASHVRRICTLGRGDLRIMVIMNQCHTTSVIVTQGSQETGTMDARSVLRVNIESLINSFFGVVHVVSEGLPYQVQRLLTVAFATSDTIKMQLPIVFCVRVESTRTSLALQRARFAPEQRVLRQAV